MPRDILASLGRRARARRLQRGWTLREIAERSGVSPRFLVQLESGRGNISVRRLADVARALETTAAGLLAETAGSSEPVVALLGLRGAGKTTIGKRLARRLRVPFVELDPSFYRLVSDFDQRFPEGAPSLRKASSLKVEGDFTFGHGVQVIGDVELDSRSAKRIPADTVLDG